MRKTRISSADEEDEAEEEEALLPQMSRKPASRRYYSLNSIFFRISLARKQEKLSVCALSSPSLVHQWFLYSLMELITLKQVWKYEYAHGLFQYAHCYSRHFLRHALLIKKKKNHRYTQIIGQSMGAREGLAKTGEKNLNR